MTELTLESPAGLIRVRAECADGKVTRRDVPQRAGVRDPPRHARSRSRSSGTVDGRRRVRRDVLRHRRGRAVRAPARRPTRARDIVRITEMIKAAAAEQLPVVHPGAAGLRRDHDRASCPGRRTTRRTTRRNVVTVSTGEARLGRGRRPGPARSTDRRAGPGRRPGWRSSTPRAGSASARTSATRASSGRSSPAARRGDDGRRRTGRSSRRITGTAWITGFARYVVDPTDPFPDGFTVGDIWYAPISGGSSAG